MNLRKKIFFLMFFVITLLVSAQIKVENSKELIIGKLSNGMTYYIYPNKMPENRVSVNVLVKAGSLQEDDNQLGMAHLIEHLCFNGTEKYSRNEVVKYYQSIGLNFGGDLNAHTGFDETVYKIQLPTDNKEQFEKGVEVLKEMTLKPTFKQEDIDSEKDIVKEEWRLGQGLSDRITKVFQKELFDGSRYGKRFPIGDMDIIAGTKREVLKNYYNKWYHPKNMAVVMVGDINTKYAQEIITKYFDYNETRIFIPREEYRIKELDNRYTVFKDKELTYVLLEITGREDYSFTDENQKAEDFYKNLLFRLLLSNKVNEEIKSGNNFIYEGGYYSWELSKDRLNTLYAVINKNKIPEGIASAVRIIKDMAVNGVSVEELNLEKENLKSMFEDAVRNRSSEENENIIPAVRKVFLNNDIFADSDDNLKYYNELSKNITPKDIQITAEKFYNDKLVSILFVPDEKSISVPDKTEFANIIASARNTEIAKKENKNFNLILEKPEIIPGNITEIKEFKNYKKIKLSNGIEFLYKQTDFEKDKIYIKLFKREGSLNNSEEMYLNSLFASDIADNSGVGNITYENLDNFMKGKEFSVGTYIDTFEQGAVIVSNHKDLETALDCFTYMIKEPKFSSKLFNTVMINTKEALENRKNSPDAVYSDKITEILFKNNLRKKIITSADLEKINEQKILEEYKNKFSDFSGYKGIILGAVSEKEAENILTKYFASLPAENTENRISQKQFLDIKYPQGIINETVTKGIDKKVKVSLFYPLKVSYSQENSYMAQTFEDILRINLIDEVREKLGGVYGISPKIFISKNENGYLQIKFATDPKRADEITEAVKKEVVKLINGEIKKSSLESVVKNYKLVYENNQKQNSWWNAYLTEKIKRGDDFEPYTPLDFETKMTEKNLIPFFEKMIDKNNFIKVILIPEREEIK